MNSPRRFTPFSFSIGTVVAIAIFAGCSGKEDAKPRPAAQQPPVQPIIQKPVPLAPPVVKTKPKPAAEPVQPKSPLLDPLVNPDDVFDAFAGGPKFDIVRDNDQLVSADTFVAFASPAGTDSSQYYYNRTDVDDVPALRSSSPSLPEGKTPQSTGHSGNGKAKSEKKFGSSKTGNSKSRGSHTTEKRNGTTKSDIERSDRSNNHEPSQLPAGFTPIASAGKSRIGLPARIRCDRDGSEMALVTGGAVVVGHDGGPAESSPQITVVLDSFYMDVTEVTLGKYMRFREIVKEEKGRNVIAEPENASSPPSYPVLGVTWLQANFYARWAGKELPTEAEWERAARGEPGFDHPWGNGRPIWKAARRPNELGAVKSYRTDLSPFGIYDLAGNAREWCADHYSPTAFAEAIHASAKQLRNWKGPRLANPEDYRVVKGNGPDWKAWHREGLNGSKHYKDVGFRCVLRLSESPR